MEAKVEWSGMDGNVMPKTLVETTLLLYPGVYAVVITLLMNPAELRHCLHGRGFICNRIGLDAVTPFVYTAPVVIRTGSF